MTPNGMAGFATKLVNPDVSVTNFHLEASGIPGDILGLLDLDTTTAVLGAQIDAISRLLVAIPVPAIAGLQVRDLSLGSDNGYVMVKGAFE